MQIWPNLREFGRICAKFARNFRKFARICETVFAKNAQICAKFTAPFVTVPFVPFQGGAGARVRARASAVQDAAALHRAASQVLRWHGYDSA